MSTARDPAGPVESGLSEARRRTATRAAPGAPRGLLALQRSAGNSAVSALLAGRLRSSGDAVSDIDHALREVRGSDPEIAVVEKGLEAAKATGVPVDLDGADRKPPASALAVTRTGFGPESVAPKKPVPPPKPVPEKSAAGKAAAKAAGKAAAKARAGPQPGRPGGSAPGAGGAGAGGSAAPAAPVPLSADQVLQPPVPPTGTRPEEDPAFVAVSGAAATLAKAKKAHPPAASKAAEAQAAAVAPADDVEGQAKAAKVDDMDAQPAGGFDKPAFIRAVKAAVEAKTPTSLEQADEFKESGKAGEVKGEVTGLVAEGKDASAEKVETATEKAPDQSKAVPKPVTPMAPEQLGPAGSLPAAGAVPKPAPAEQLNLEAGKHQADQAMAEGGVTEEQLARSNEPDFQQAVADKKVAAEHAVTAPAEYRQQERQVIAQSKAESAEQAATAVSGMHGAKAGALAALVTQKQATKSKDEQKRAEVTAKVQSIFAATEADVKQVLDGIDPKVEQAFDAGEQVARQQFERYVDAKMAAYKRDRYGGWLGGLRWAKDKLLGMPDRVNEFYAAGKELYLQEMDRVISRVADIVGAELGRAKQRIAKGKAEISTYVKGLSPDLQKVGSHAAADIADRFADLESDVDAKQEALVETLAARYTEARKGLDERIEALQAENRGLVDKAIGAIKGVINTIRELAAMLTGVLARAAGVVGDIIKDPIGFLGNLVSAVKGGILRFKDNILDHLKKGLTGWLFGSLAEAGIAIPDTFDVKGIIKLLASIFGLTWANIRNRIVKQVGEKAMSAIEKGVDVFQKLASQGVAGLWELLVEKLGNIKDMILEKVQDFVVTRVITAGITWLVSMLNPAAAFIKACKLIYDVIMFFVHNGSRIMKLVNTVLDSVADIVRGNVGGVAARIEEVLGQLVPILIGFLASVIGLGGIGQKVREIVQTLQKPVGKALDLVIKQGLELAGPVIRGLKGLGTKAKAKIAAGKAYVKGRVEQAKDKVLGRLSPTDVKARARQMLGGRSFRSDAEAKGSLDRVYAALAPKGLKSLRFVPGAPGKKPAVFAAASPAERIELATTAAEVIRIALTMQVFTGRTTAFVTYADGRRFGPASGYSNRGGHAELRIASDVPRLLQAIRRDRARGVVPAEGRTPVFIDINRLPCDHCVDRLTAAFAGIDDVALVVRAASVWRQHTGGIDLTSDAGIARLAKLARIEPLHIWPLIESKLRSFGLKEVQVGRTVYDIDVWLNLNAAKNGVGAFDVEDKVAELNRRQLHEQQVGR